MEYNGPGLQVGYPDSYHWGLSGSNLCKDHGPVSAPAIELLEFVGGKFQDCPLAVDDRKTI